MTHHPFARPSYHPAVAAMLAVFILPGMVPRANAADPLVVDASARPEPPRGEGFKMGPSRAPDGRELPFNSVSLVRDGKPWLPAMGEFHFARYPADEWRDELLKMKGGGVDS